VRPRYLCVYVCGVCARKHLWAGEYTALSQNRSSVITCFRHSTACRACARTRLLDALNSKRGCRPRASMREVREGGGRYSVRVSDSKAYDNGPPHATLQSIGAGPSMADLRFILKDQSSALGGLKANRFCAVDSGCRSCCSSASWRA